MTASKPGHRLRLLRKDKVWRSDLSRRKVRGIGVIGRLGDQWGRWVQIVTGRRPSQGPEKRGDLDRRSRGPRVDREERGEGGPQTRTRWDRALSTWYTNRDQIRGSRDAYLRRTEEDRLQAERWRDRGP